MQSCISGANGAKDDRRQTRNNQDLMNHNCIKSTVHRLVLIFCLAAFSLAAINLANGSIADLAPDNSTLNNSTSENSTSDVNESAIKGVKTAEVAAYVYNDDDDSLDVSLYIDSVPKGRTDVSKGEEEAFGNYTLNLGFHRFKITWKDPDTEKVYESEQKEEITDDDVISLYTTEHNEPDEHDLTVSVKNENDKSTNAYLYIDGIYENNKEISEESTDDFSSASVEEGVHDISVRWLDPYTNDQYEKTKRITIEGDSAVIFVASRGASFEDFGEFAKTAETATSTAETSYFKSSTSMDDAVTAVEGEIDEDSGTYDGTEGSNENDDQDSADNENTIGTSTESLAIENDIENEGSAATGTLYSMKSLSATETPDEKSSKQKNGGWSNVSIVYPLILLAAAYLVLRH